MRVRVMGTLFFDKGVKARPVFAAGTLWQHSNPRCASGGGRMLLCCGVELVWGYCSVLQAEAWMGSSSRVGFRCKLPPLFKHMAVLHIIPDKHAHSQHYPVEAAAVRGPMIHPRRVVVHPLCFECFGDLLPSGSDVPMTTTP